MLFLRGSKHDFHSAKVGRDRDIVHSANNEMALCCMSPSLRNVTLGKDNEKIAALN